MHSNHDPNHDPDREVEGAPRAQSTPAQPPTQPPTQPPHGPAPRPVTVRTTRPWLVATTALVTLLVLIAAIGNQGVVDAVNRHVSGTSFWDNTARAATYFRWRFSPFGDHDFAHLWLAGLLAIGVVLVLTLLLVAAVARGRGGFGPAFVAVWLAVVGATLLSGYASAAVIDERKLGVVRDTSKANAIFYSSSSPGAYAVAAGIGYGLVVALVAALVAVLTRRTETLHALGAVPLPPPGEPLRSQPQPWGAAPVSGPSAQHTAVLPRSEQPEENAGGPGAEQTAQLPAVEPDVEGDQYRRP